MFANTRYFSPVVTEGITKAPRDSYEWHEWWDIHNERCLNGYSVAGTKITGHHYHYLNFWNIRAKVIGRNYKRLQPPRFLDIDHDFYWEVVHCKEAGKDLLILKRRQCGYSYKTSHLAGYEYSFVPDSHTIITAGEEKYANGTFRMMKDGLNKMAQTEFHKNSIIKSRTEYHAGYEVEDEYGNKFTLGYNSHVERITATTPQAIVGRSASLIIYEEISKFKGIKAVLGYNEAGMESENEKTGFQVLVGTGGEEHTSIDEVTDMFYAPDTYNLMSYENIHERDDSVAFADRPQLNRTCLFIPGDRYKIVDKDGNSLIEESREAIREKRKSKEGDKKAWITAVTQEPLTPSEALMIPEGGVFNVYELRKQKANLLKYKSEAPLHVVGDIEWIRDSQSNIIGAEWVDDIHGPFRRTEPPIFDAKPGLYVCGTDSYDKDQAADAKRSSFGAARIHKKFHNLDSTDDVPVCGLIDRPETSNDFYEQTAKLCVYYNRAMNLIEYSNVLIFDWYRRNGFGDIIRARPAIAYAASPNSKVQSRDGIDPNLKHIFIQKGKDYVEKNAHKITDLVLIDKLIAFRDEKKYNCDETIAFCLSVLHAWDDMLPVTKKTDEKKFRAIRYGVREGRMVRF